MDSRYCASCGRELLGQRFCVWCGAPAPAPASCPSCGKELAPGQRFCIGCGKPLEAPAAPGVAPQMASQPAEPRKRSRKLPALAAGLGGLVLLAALWLVLFSGSGGTRPRDDQRATPPSTSTGVGGYAVVATPTTPATASPRPPTAVPSVTQAVASAVATRPGVVATDEPPRLPTTPADTVIAVSSPTTAPAIPTATRPPASTATMPAATPTPISRNVDFSYLSGQPPDNVRWKANVVDTELEIELLAEGAFWSLVEVHDWADRYSLEADGRILSGPPNTSLGIRFALAPDGDKHFLALIVESGGDFYVAGNTADKGDIVVLQRKQQTLLRPAGQLNSFSVTVDRTTVRVTLNGAPLTSFQLPGINTLDVALYTQGRPGPEGNPRVRFSKLEVRPLP